MGQLANDVRAALESALEDCSKKLESAALEHRLKAEALDVTVPGKAPKQGCKPPMYIALDEIKELCGHGLHRAGRPRGGAGRAEL